MMICLREKYILLASAQYPAVATCDTVPRTTDRRCWWDSPAESHEIKSSQEQPNQKLSLVANSDYISDLFTQSFSGMSGSSYLSRTRLLVWFPRIWILDKTERFMVDILNYNTAVGPVKLKLKLKLKISSSSDHDRRKWCGQCGQITLWSLQFSSIKFFTVIFVPDFINS